MITVGLDLDGVLYKWHDSLYEYFRLYRGFAGSYLEFWKGIDKEVRPEEWDYLVQIDTLYSNVPPTKVCKNFLEELSKIAEIFYVTARPNTVASTTSNFLMKYKFPFRENLVFTSHKDSAARLYRFSLFVDDTPEHVEKCAKVTNTLLFSQPWNFEYQDKYKTVRTYAEILNVAKEIANNGYN